MSFSNGLFISRRVSFPTRSPFRAVAVGLAASILLLSACDTSPDAVATDSLLTRDLTLATTSSAPAYTPGLADTAVSDPSRGPSRDPVNRAAAGPAVLKNTPSQSPTPSRPQGVVPKAPAPVAVARTSVPASSASEVAPPSIGVGAQASSAAAGTEAVAATASSGDKVRESSSVGSNRSAFGTGTMLIGRTNTEICSLANRPGDRLVATLTNDVVSADGMRLAAGTPVLVEMSAPTSKGDFVFRVKAVQVAGQLVPIEGTVTVTGETKEHAISKGGDKGKVISGAIAGAIIGRVLGGGAKGTIIGAAGGAAAGTAAAARNTVAEKCLSSGATLTVTLTAPLVLTEGVP